MHEDSKNFLRSLLNLGFAKAGVFILEGEDLIFKIEEKYTEQRDLLYCFSLDGLPVYVGKTSQILRNRLAQYRRPGRSQKTNRRVNLEIIKSLKHGGKLEIYVLTSPKDLRFRGFRLNLAAGLEDSVIKNVSCALKSVDKQIWNIAGTNRQY